MMIIYQRMLACLLLLAALPACSATVPSGCAPIYAGADGWAIEQCAADPNVPSTMVVMLDGDAKGNAALLRIAHKTHGGPGAPQIALIYASAYVRLKQNADPIPAIPFG